MRHKSKGIMKEEKCFACGKKTKQKKRSRRLETLSRVERVDESVTNVKQGRTSRWISNYYRCYEKNEDLPDQWLHGAAKRLKVMTSNVDVFASDVFYHKSCYNRYVYCYDEKSATKTEITDGEISVLPAE